MEQAAQLSQRDRTTLRVIEDFAKSVEGIGQFKLRLGLFKRFIRLREYPILKPILG